MNRIDQIIDSQEDADQYEEDETPADRPAEYPKDLPVKLLRIKEWIEDSGEFSFCAYARKGTDGIVRCDIPGHLVLSSGRFEPIWENSQVKEVRPAPSPGIPASFMVIPVHDAAQSLLGLEDAEAELLFYGQDLDGNECEELSLAFLEHLVQRSTNYFPGLHMTDEEVETYRAKWCAERDAPWEEGQVSPKAFAA